MPFVQTACLDLAWEEFELPPLTHSTDCKVSIEDCRQLHEHGDFDASKCLSTFTHWHFVGN